MKLIILVGIPGSGKSHRAKEIAKENPGYIILSKDELITDEFGAYNFDPRNIQSVTRKHLKDILTALQLSTPGIIVDNTNISIVLRQTILLFAKIYDYLPSIVVINSGLSDQELFERNVHNVPLETISAMRKLLEDQGLY